MYLPSYTISLTTTVFLTDIVTSDIVSIWKQLTWTLSEFAKFLTSLLILITYEFRFGQCPTHPLEMVTVANRSNKVSISQLPASTHLLRITLPLQASSVHRL